MREVNIALELLSIVISIVLLYSLIVDKKNKLNKIFIGMLITNIFVLLFDCITWVITSELDVLLNICNFFIYSFGYVINVLFTIYIINYLSISGKRKKILYILNIVFCSISILLVVISMFNGMYFIYKDGIYIRGKMYWLSQFFPLIILILNSHLIISNKSATIKEKISLLVYQIMPIIALVIQMHLYGITLIYIATTISMLFIYATIHIFISKKMVLQEIEIAQANISIMLNQIQPHFIYNTLTSIYALCDIDPQRAKAAIIDFSRFLRDNIDSIKNKVPLPFEKELKHIQVYLNLEKMRFGDKINIIYDIQVTDFLIPLLTVQPIVENAIIHGIGVKEMGGTIKILTKEEDNKIIIDVIDDGVGFDSMLVHHDDKTHIGINNVTNRLKSLCNGYLKIESTIGVGTKVSIILPKETINDKSISN